VAGDEVVDDALDDLAGRAGLAVRLFGILQVQLELRRLAGSCAGKRAHLFELLFEGLRHLMVGSCLNSRSLEEDADEDLGGRYEWQIGSYRWAKTPILQALALNTSLNHGGFNLEETSDNQIASCKCLP